MSMNNWHNKLEQAVRKGIAYVECRLKQWTLPTRTHQTISTLADLNRSKRALIAENMFLRQQLIVLERQVERPRVTQRDRQILVLLASRLQLWRDALIIVKPDTLIGWHRLGFKLYWRRKSRVRQGRPPIPVETIALIKAMCVHNRTWRAKRIQGELLKVGIRVSKETIKKYLRQVRKGVPPLKRGQTWATFLANHARETWACDFVQVYDLFFRVIFVYFIIELGSRRVVQYGVTRSPSDAWVAQ
ncbi:MAG: helix-turn-helix domain-containing protein [Chloroflexota bacterium]